MKPTLCSKCKKNLAVVFITKIEDGQTNNEGYCLKCARELGINLKQGYNGNLSARDNGYVGGYMVKKMIEDYERNSSNQQ